MILRIAWLNVWRSRGRSLVVIGSIIVGIMALIVGNGFMNGFMIGYMAETINNDISNIQIHHPEFKTDYDVKFNIEDGHKKAETMLEWEGVKAVATRAIVTGMISSPQKAAGTQIRGIDVENEARVTRLDSMVSIGTYFVGVSRNPIVIGSKLAENLKVKEKSKVVLTFNDGNGDITAGAFRVVGIVESSSLGIGELYSFVRQEDLNRLIGLGNQVHEIALLTDSQTDEYAIVDKYKQMYPNDLAETWREVAPELALMQEMYGSMLYVLMFIILLALVFGIVNTMLMAVLERFRELGMLMAVGMNKARIFAMILLETIYLGIIGSPFGLFFSWLVIEYYSTVGVDLSRYSEGLESFGYSNILYPYVEVGAYFVVTFGVILTAFVGALYPARKAIKLRPVEALHTV